MIKIKEKNLAEKIEKNPITKEQFAETLKKVCKPIESAQEKSGR
jgi:hypothetical protein